MDVIDRIRFWVSRKLSQFLLYHRFKGSFLLRKYLCRLLMPRPPQGPLICDTIFGVKVRIDPLGHKGLESSIYYFGEYEAGTLYVLEQLLGEGDIFLDVGANIGFISIVVACFIGKGGLVYAVEPHPLIFKELQENISLNQAKNIVPLNVALGSGPCEAMLYDNLDINWGSASLIPPKNRGTATGRPVKVTSIDELIQSGYIQTPDVVKIDVEDFELEVLKGSKNLLSSANAPALCVEFSTLHAVYGGNLHDIYDFIKEINCYRAFRCRLGKEVPSTLVEITKIELPKHDNLFFLLPKHIGKIKSKVAASL